MEVFKEENDAHRKPLEQLEEQPVDNTLTSNDLVLESICTFLSVQDLKSLRLASRRLSRGAARILAKKAVVCLTSKTLAGQEVSIVANSIISEPPYVDCKCLLDSGRCRYFSVDHESFPGEPVWETGFRPRKLSLLGCAVAYRLSPEQFGSVQELEITRYNGASGIRLLQDVAILFPQLKSITFKKIQPHCWVKFAKCCCSFCKGYLGNNVVSRVSYYHAHFKRDADRFLTVDENRCVTLEEDRIVTLDEDESTGTSEPYAAIPLTDEQRRAASKLPLKKLSFEVSPHSNEYDWEITKYFSRLEALEIKSFQDRSLMAMQWNHDLYFVDSSSIWFARVSSYVDCLQSIFRHLPTSSIRHVSLKCGPGDTEILQELLNQLRPHTVSLEIANFDLAFLPLPGLKNHIMEAMNTLRVHFRYAQSFLQVLYKTRFFSKSQWTLVFENEKYYWMRMEKTETYFILQESGYTSIWDSPPVYWEIDTLMRVHQPSLPNYSYAFHRYGTTNGFEILRPELLFHRNLLEANWMRIKDFICATCKSFPRLLVDLPKFRQEANISFLNPPPCDTQHYDRAWTFCAVPQNVLTKWTQRLDLETAAAKPTRSCSCRSWNAAAKFGRAYPSSLPNPEEPEPQVAYDPSLDPTMESHGYSQSESLERDFQFVQ